MNTRPDSALTNEMTPVGGPVAADHRHRDRRAHAEAADQLELLGILDRLLEQLVGDLGDQLRLAVAQDLRGAALVARCAIG